MRIFILLLLAASVHAGETFVKETISPGIFDRAVVAESLPGVSNQVAIVQQLFKEHPADVIIRLAIYTSLGDATSAERQRSETHISLEQWEANNQAQQKKATPALEIVKLGGFAAIRRFNEGHVKAFAIPHYQNLAENLSEMGSVYFVAVTAEEHRASWTGLPAGVSVRLFLKYNGMLNSEELHEVVSRLQINKVTGITVLASPDARYVLATDMPAFNRFINPDWYKEPGSGEVFYCSKHRSDSLFSCDP